MISKLNSHFYFHEKKVSKVSYFFSDAISSFKMILKKRNFYPLFLQFNFFIKLKVAKKSSNFCVNCFPSKILQVLNQKVIIFFGKQPIFSCNKFCLCCFVVCYLLSIRTWKWHFIYNFENFFIIWGGFFVIKRVWYFRKFR